MGGPRYVCGLPPTASRAEALGAGRPPIKTDKRTRKRAVGYTPICKLMEVGSSVRKLSHVCTELIHH